MNIHKYVFHVNSLKRAHDKNLVLVQSSVQFRVFGGYPMFPTQPTTSTKQNSHTFLMAMALIPSTLLQLITFLERRFHNGITLIGGNASLHLNPCGGSAASLSYALV